MSAAGEEDPLNDVPEEPGDHYGLIFLSEIKRTRNLGGFFTYQQYQQLKASKTAEEFKDFLSSTALSGLRVYRDAKVTFHELILKERLADTYRFEQTQMVLDSTSQGCLPALLLLPYTLIADSVKSNRRRRKILQQIDELKEKSPLV